jgi:hypothetical protein
MGVSKITFSWLRSCPAYLKIFFCKNLYPAEVPTALMCNQQQKAMHDITRDFLVSLAAFATLFGIIYIIVTTRHRERMSMLEKGVSPSTFGSKDSFASNTLKFGMLSVGLAFGILAGNMLYRSEAIERAPAFFSMTFLFGGLALILNFIVDRKLRR